jgi:hypothetical protein
MFSVDSLSASKAGRQRMAPPSASPRLRPHDIFALHVVVLAVIDRHGGPAIEATLG